MKHPEFDRLIIVSQPIHEEIPEKVMIAAMPSWMKELPREVVEFRPAHIPHGSTDINWRELQMEQRLIFEKELEPLLSENSHDLIAYFGMAPIPLCMHLGYLIPPTFTNIHVFQKLHGKAIDDLSSWSLPVSTNVAQIPEFQQEISGMIEQEIKVRGKAIIRVESSFPAIFSEDCLVHVPDPLAHIYISHPNRDKAFRKDPFTQEGEIHSAAKRFAQVLENVHNNLPGLEEIHLFAAVQPAVAFLMGREIYTTTTKPVFCYQYHTATKPHYERALFLQDSGLRSIEINAEESLRITAIREAIAADLENNVRPFAKSIQEQVGKNWFESLETNTDPWKPAFSGRDSQWGTLSVVSENRFLTEFPVALNDFDQSRRSFYDSAKQHWTLSDQLIYLASQRIPVEDDLLQAFRIFFFHEAVHNVDHGITPHTSRGLGNFPNVLAEADYQADVYAFIHEYHLAIRNKNSKAAKPQLFFADLISLSTEMMWAFDSIGYPLELETRRIQRYLTLYFQLLKIRHHDCKDLYSVLEILNRRPNIDIFGLKPTFSENRPASILVEGQGSQIAVAIWHKTLVRRLTATEGLFDPELLVQGFRERNGKLVLEALEGIVDTVLAK